MTDNRDIVDRLAYPAAHANKRRLMREAAEEITILRGELLDAHAALGADEKAQVIPIKK